MIGELSFSPCSVLKKRLRWLMSVGFTLMSASASAITIDVVADKEIVSPGEWVMHKIVVANNDSVTRTGVVVTSNMPTSMSLNDNGARPAVSNCGTRCDTGDTPTWNLGDIPAGASKTIYAHMVVNNFATDGTVMTLNTSLAHDGAGVADTDSVTTEVDENLGVDLKLHSANQTVAPNDQVEIEVSFGNMSATGYATTELRASIPTGATLVSASDGGAQSGSDVVWNTGVVNGGEFGKRTFVVSIPSSSDEGDVYRSLASFAGNGSVINTASDLLVVKNNTGISLDVSASHDVQQNQNWINYRYVVSNQSNVTKSGVNLTLKADRNFGFYDGAAQPSASGLGCSTYCGDNSEDWALYDLGDLSAGESKVITLQMVRSTSPANAQVFVQHAFVKDSTDEFSLSRATTVINDDENTLDLILGASNRVVAPSETFQYELSFGNLDTSTYQNLEMELALPEGVTFVSASDGGAHSNGIVTWSLGNLNSGATSKRYVEVQVPAGTAEGAVLSSKANLNTGGAAIVRSGESVVVNSDQDLIVKAVVSDDISQDGRSILYRYIVSNTGLVSKTNVSLTLKSDNYLSFYDGASIPSFSGCGTYCGDSAEDWATYDFGELAAGESKVVNIHMTREVGVLGGQVLRTDAIVRDGNNEFAKGHVSTMLAQDDSTLDLVVAANNQLVSSGETYEYELSFGNIDSSSYQNTVLEFDLPEGATFVSATDGGTHSSGTVTWNVGTFNSGVSSKRYVVVQAPASQVDGTILNSVARIHTGSAPLVRAGESVVIRANTGLNLDVALTGDTSQLGNTVDVRYLVSNTSLVSKTNVTLRVKSDNWLEFYDGASFPSASGCGSFCGDSVEDWATYDLGELVAGESKVVTIQMIRESNIADGQVLRSLALVTDGTDEYSEGRVSAVLSETDPSLDLVLAASDQLIESSETYEYELSFGNVDSSSYQNLVMELDLPEGATFVSASDGGTLSNGTVSWSLGTVSAGSSGKRFVSLQAPASQVDGTILSSRARLHTGGASLMRASESVVVNADTGLNLDVSVSNDLSQPQEYVDYRYVVTNTDTVSKTDVQLVLKAENHLRFADGATFPAFDAGCGTVCGDSTEDYAIYELGELSVGESKVVGVQMYRSSADVGDVLTSRAMVRDGANEFTLGKVSSVLVSDENSLNLAVSASDQLIESSETYEYELAFGNIDDSSYQNLVMELDLPKGVTFVSATDGGTYNAGAVSWDLGTVSVNTGSKRYVTVQAPASLVDGTILASRARLHTGSDSLARASESVVVKANSGLSLDVVTSGGDPGDWTNIQYVVANTGSVSKTDVVLSINTDGDILFQDGSSLPGASGCSTICGDSTQDLASYALGELLPGESRIVSIEAYYPSFVAGEIYSVRANLKDGSDGFTHGNTVNLAGLPGAGLSITSDDYIVSPNSDQSFEVTAGWRASSTVRSNLLMVVDIPEEYSFVSASGTYTVVNDQVIWPIGNLAATSWRNETLVLRTASGLSDATVIPVQASLKDDSELALLRRSSVASVIDSTPHLDLVWATTTNGSLTADSTISTVLTATNSGASQVADVELNFSDAFDFEFRASNAVPAASGCSTDCGDSIGDWAFWDLGNLDASANAAVSFSSTSRTFSSNFALGKLQLAHAVLRHSSGNRHDYVLHKAIGTGPEFSVDPEHDSDEDGMPDVWELRYGLDRLTDDADGDLDGSGSSNLQEFIGGSDPTDPDSEPACVVSAGASGSTSVRETLSGTLDASASAISVGGSLSFNWTQLSGPTVTFADATAAVTAFTAPVLSADADAVFQVTVGSACDVDRTAMVTVSLLNNQAPNADAGPDQSNIEIGDTVMLNGSNSSDPETDDLSYSWSEQSSFGVTLSDADVASPTFTAPNPGTSGGALTFELTVTDSFGDADTDTVIVNVDSCPPTADAGANIAVTVGGVFNLDASNSADSCNDGGIASYAWVQTAGMDTVLSDPAASAPMATAPDTAGTLTYELTVTDTDGFSDTDTVSVNVSDVPLPDLTCRAGTDQSVDEGAEVTLNGASSTISDTSLDITYMWALTASTSNSMVTLSAPNSVETQFTAPEVGSGLSEAHTFTLTCSVDTGSGVITDTDTVIVNVGDVAINTAPVADAGADDDVNEGGTYMLDGTGSSDPDGDSLTYLWSQDSGPAVTLSSTTDAMPSFTAPDVSSTGAVLVFELTVSDGQGGVNSDTVNINVTDVNQTPSADAGSSQAVEEGDQVAFDASASSDPDGDTLSFSWTQVSGTSVTITGADSATPSFTAPDIDADVTLTFEVTVSDGSLSDSATVTVTVEDVPDTGGNGSGNGGSSGGGSSGGGSSGGGSVDLFLLGGLIAFFFLAMRRREDDHH